MSKKVANKFKGQRWLKQEAERVIKEYQYLDEIKDLRGWMWEFIRRSKRYQALYRFMESVCGKTPEECINQSDSSKPSNPKDFFSIPECEDILKWFREKQKRLSQQKHEEHEVIIPLVTQDQWDLNPFALGIRFCNIGITQTSGPIFTLSSLSLNPDHYCILGYGKYRDHDKEVTIFTDGIPRPSVPYSDFDERFKPVIAGLQNVVHYPYRTIMDHLLWMADVMADWLGESTLDIIDTGESKTFNPNRQQRKKYITQRFQSFLADLSPVTPKDTIFLGISKNVRTKDELLLELEPILDKLIKPSKKREPKQVVWKYYLIAYDLMENDGYEKYSLVTEVMTMVYSDIRRIDRKVGEDYYKAGKEMINGGYRKYLKQFTNTPIKILQTSNGYNYVK